MSVGGSCARADAERGQHAWTLSVARLVIVSIPTAVGALGAGQTGFDQKLSCSDQCKRGYFSPSMRPCHPEPRPPHPLASPALRRGLTGTVAPSSTRSSTPHINPAGSAVGSVRAHQGGFVDATAGHKVSLDTDVTRSVGTVRGHAAGPIRAISGSQALDIDLTLTILSRKAALTAATEANHIQLPDVGTPVTGSVTVG